MTPIRARLARWLDVRPAEVRAVTLSTAGAFMTLAFLVMARALREALYLSSFAVETLPYITAAVAVLSVPTVAVFARFLAKGRPQAVILRVAVGLAAGLALLSPALSGSRVAVIVFYVWTALGTLLITSGFWLIAAELFPVRGAKRLFGVIGAGGTAGAMVTGNALALLTARFALPSLVPGLILLLALFVVVQLALPRLDSAPARDSDGRTPGRSLRRSLELVLETPHLRTISLVVATATVASTLVDYQFKELARETLDSGEALAGFFGAFYGWTGAVALTVQVLVTSRVIGTAGLAIALGVLPAILFFGSIGFLVLPGIVVATIVRGADNSLRKSLHRSALEVMFVPLPAGLRRRTKTFIDSVADSAAEGTGAAIVFVIVTLGGLPSRSLSFVVAVIAFGFLWLARHAGRSYLQTVAAQLRAGARAAVFADKAGLEEAAGLEDEAELEDGAELADGRDLMSATFSRVDLRSAIEDARGPDARGPVPTASLARRGRPPAPATIGDRVDLPVGGLTRPGRRPEGGSPEILALLERTRGWGPERVHALTLLLARDALYGEVTELLAGVEEHALEQLGGVLNDPEASFVVRRRIPAILGRYADVRADTELLGGIDAPRFEVRYRSAIALVRRRRAGRLVDPTATTRVWAAVRAEMSRGRPVWELQRLLDDDEVGDPFVAEHLEVRGQLSLEHSFRLLSLVLDPEAVSSAYHGLARGRDRLRSLALEYLDQALPDDVRDRLWPFIGDLSARQQSARARPIGDVVSDLITSSATVFVTEEERKKLRDLLGGS